MPFMRIIRFFLPVCLLFFSLSILAQPRPNAQQLRWHELEFYLFIHFGPNTFTGKEWGHGDEPEDLFNPTQLDCGQWCRIAKKAGAKGIIITAKHHDGFCLWPSKYSKHTVRESKWKQGKGDVLKELSAACKKYGLLFGVYISPWDRNHPQYGSPGYNDVYVNTMKEVVKAYGPIFEMWWDGANGEGPNGRRQEYDFRRFEKTIRQIAPNAVVFSDIGPDIRWVGNESGIAGETNWNTLDTAGFKRGTGGPPTDTLNRGNEWGQHWIPAECDVSIRPGWFYHPEEDGKVKPAKELFQLYLKSVGRGANFLLNVPPDRRGLFHPGDSAALVEYGALIRRQFDTNLARRAMIKTYFEGEKASPISTLTDGRLETGVGWSLLAGRKEIELSFKQPVKANCLILQEQIGAGQSISGVKVVIHRTDGSSKEYALTTIGRKRILVFDGLYEILRVQILLTGAKDRAALGEVGLYRLDD